jgi:hypothetical protein
MYLDLLTIDFHDRATSAATMGPDVANPTGD